MGPIKEATFGEGGNGDAGMMKRQRFGMPEGTFAVIEIAIPDGEQEVDDSGEFIAFEEHQHSDAKEEDDLDKAKEKILFGELAEQVAAGYHQQEDVQGNDQETPEIKGVRGFASEMTDGMGQEQDAGKTMEPNAIAF